MVYHNTSALVVGLDSYNRPGLGNPFSLCPSHFTLHLIKSSEKRWTIEFPVESLPQKVDLMAVHQIGLLKLNGRRGEVEGGTSRKRAMTREELFSGPMSVSHILV